MVVMADSGAMIDMVGDGGGRWWPSGHSGIWVLLWHSADGRFVFFYMAVAPFSSAKSLFLNGRGVHCQWQMSSGEWGISIGVVD